MLFWHLGGTIWIFRYVFKDPAADLRILAVGGLLPGLLDKPLALAVAPGAFDAHRIYGHTLLFALAGLAVAVLGTARGTPTRKRAVAFAVGLLIHLLLDAMWTMPETLFWPAFGFGFTPTDVQTFGDLLSQAAQDPVAIGLEIAGLLYVLGLARRAGLGDPARRRRFARTGQIAPPE